MALLYLDGFEHYGTTNVDDTWTILEENKTPYTKIVAEGRTTTHALCFDQSRETGDNGYWQIALSKGQVGQTSGVLGFALRIENLGDRNPGQWNKLIEITDGNWQCIYVTIHVDGTMTMHAKGTVDVFDLLLAGPSTFSVEDDVWHYVELKWTIHPTAGAMHLKVDGMTIFDLTNVSTDGLSPNGDQWTTIRLGGNSAFGHKQFIDDLYLLDTTGAVNNDFLGDITVKTVFVEDDGAYSQWTPSTPGDHYVLVDEADPDDDATYVETETLNDVDTYVFADVATTDTIVGVQLSVNVRKSDQGDAAISSRVRYSSVDYDEYSNAFQEPFGLGGITEYYYVDFPWDTHPNGSSWTPTLVNDSEFGFIKTR